MVNLCKRGGQLSWEIARQNLTQSKITSKRFHDKKLRQYQFHVGDMVLVKGPPRAKKLDPKYEGPYEIVHVFDEHNVSIKKRQRMPETINTERLLPYHQHQERHEE